MLDTFYCKTGDTALPLFYQLDPAVDLTGATVTFSMRLRGGTVAVIDAAPATVANGTYDIPGLGSVAYDPSDGVLIYDWQAGDTDTAGDYEAEFTVTLAGKPMTGPMYGRVFVKISDKI